jgi:hypothetical protein
MGWPGNSGEGWGVIMGNELDYNDPVKITSTLTYTEKGQQPSNIIFVSTDQALIDQMKASYNEAVKLETKQFEAGAEPALEMEAIEIATGIPIDIETGKPIEEVPIDEGPIATPDPGNPIDVEPPIVVEPPVEPVPVEIPPVKTPPVDTPPVDPAEDL